ncbi:MAG: anti-sigma factor [Acidobacteria bacterium]|nr:MAG: anti-sigma factor [Acidobacteriota bacterium]PYT43662.1 MAG: anti-sigma factor [Acidobacteriota bacterium]PYT59617.1 MAG: anti-sigma factor [Acidobacteriota bacterium]
MAAAAGAAQTPSEAEPLFSQRCCKLNCKGVIREISDYIDGDLDLSVRQELERHLEHCEDCKMVVDQTRLTVDIFCDSKPIELTSDVKSRLHDALRRKLQETGN